MRQRSLKKQADDREVTRLKVEYFKKFGQPFGDVDGPTGKQDYWYKCQLCWLPIRLSNADFHHKRKKSEQGKTTPDNGVCLHRTCHTWIHPDKVKCVAESVASLENAMRIELPVDVAIELKKEISGQMRKFFG